MEEKELEQPTTIEGSKEDFGKFKDAESLLKAYNHLESEFTKKSQRLAVLESENEKTQVEQSRILDCEKKVDEFVTKFEMIKPFSSALKEILINDENATLETEAVKLITNNYKSAEDFINDGDFLNKYVFSNQEIKDKIVRDYLSQVTQNSPIKVSNGNIPLTPPKLPTTIKEAGNIAKSIIKQK